MSLCDHSHIPIALTLTKLLCALCANRKTCHQAHKQHKYYLRLCVCFKYASFYRRFQSFQSLFGPLFSLFSVAVWIYFNESITKHWTKHASRPQGPFDYTCTNFLIISRWSRIVAILFMVMSYTLVWSS